jgi:hypothetical protein
MSIQFNMISSNDWVSERAVQNYKHKNVKYINDFNALLHSAITDLDLHGQIHYKNGDSKDNIKGKFLYYNYGSPAPWLCKLLPEGYGFLHFEPNDIYKSVKAENGIQQKLLSLYDRGLFTRYTQPKNQNKIYLPDNFILVSMQNVGSTVWYRKNFTELAEQIIEWSRENKKNVVFKWHNGCIDHSNPERWFNELNQKSDYAFLDYTTPLYTLIKSCDMMWTASSMSGIEALICNKPVSIFGQTEYMEMCNVCDNPDQAINATIPSDLEQWFTYYVKYYCINIYTKNSLNRIKNRIHLYFSKDISLNELILS